MTNPKDLLYALNIAAAWIERMRGEADDEDVAWVVASIREARDLIGGSAEPKPESKDGTA